MLRANALFIVVVIALVIGILGSSLIVTSYFQRLQVQRDLLIKKLESNANSAIYILLSGSAPVPYEEEIQLDLFGDENDSVTIRKKWWGLFEVAAVKARQGNFEKYKSVMYGYKPDEQGKAAVYLTDQNSPLLIAGNTFIKGDCYLPQRGVKRAYIEGQPFSGKNLIEGVVKNSSFQLPSIDQELVKKLSGFIDRGKDDFDGSMELFNGVQRDTISRSFIEKTLLIYNSGHFSLRGKNYKGNIIVCSDKVVEIDSSSRLEDVLIFAPGVKVAEYFKGSVQIFSKDSIVIGKHCQFLYPSSLGLLKKESTLFMNKIILGEEGSFKGIIFANEINQGERKTYVEIGRNTEVEGQIYSDGYVDIKGSVFGNVTCNNFFLKTPSSSYENHLLNACIDATKLSSVFIGSSIVSSNNRKGIAKWLE